jgi:hypothetical protein
LTLAVLVVDTNELKDDDDILQIQKILADELCPIRLSILFAVLPLLSHL